MLLAQILEGEIEPVPHLITHNTADADPTRLSERLQTRRDIHTVAKDVLTFCNNIAQVDPDAELDPLIDPSSRIAFDHAALQFDRATHRIDDARKFHQHAVAGVLYGTASMLRDLRIDQLAEVGLEPFMRPLLIRPHQARIARHISGQDRGETARLAHVSSPAARRRPDK